MSAGTGFFGSLTYSSNACAPLLGLLKSSAPPSWKYSVRVSRPRGGHVSYLCQALRPVSNTYASGRSGAPFPFKYALKKGSSMFCW